MGQSPDAYNRHAWARKFVLPVTGMPEEWTHCLIRNWGDLQGTQDVRASLCRDLNCGQRTTSVSGGHGLVACSLRDSDEQAICRGRGLRQPPGTSAARGHDGQQQDSRFVRQQAARRGPSQCLALCAGGSRAPWRAECGWDGQLIKGGRGWNWPKRWTGLEAWGLHAGSMLDAPCRGCHCLTGVFR